MLPFLGGGFAYDYLDTFEVLTEVRDSTNEYPDYEFIVAQTLLHVDHLNHSIVIHGVDIDEDALQARLDQQLTQAQKLVDAPSTQASSTDATATDKTLRSEERRVGKEGRSRWPPHPEKKTTITQ